jgi:hypothetical protein
VQQSETKLVAWAESEHTRLANETLMTLGYPQLIGGSGGGGGGRRMPEYDRSFVSYLLGGDSDDHLLLLAQFHEPGVQGFSVRAFYVIPSTAAPGQVAVDAGGGQPVGAGPVTPTPPPELLANTRLQIGVIVEPKAGAPGLTLAVGTAAVHEAHVGNLEAWWYQGAWDSNGEWADDNGLTSLVWRTDTDVYQLVSDAVPLEDLIKVAESLQKR